MKELDVRLDHVSDLSKNVLESVKFVGSYFKISISVFHTIIFGYHSCNSSKSFSFIFAFSFVDEGKDSSIFLFCFIRFLDHICFS